METEEIPYWKDYKVSSCASSIFNSFVVGFLYKIELGITMPKASSSYVIHHFLVHELELLPLTHSLLIWQEAFLIFQTNAVRGVIAAICCAAFFIILSLIVKYRWRPPTDETPEVYKRKDSDLKMEPIGHDNPAMEKTE